VIPIETGITDDEVIGERLAFLHVRLGDVGNAVHLDRDADAVPVHGAGLVELVLEMDDQAIADMGLD
jgi:hypothetical protein